MSQTQGKPRRSYASAGAYISGSNALKPEEPAYIPSYETAAPRPRRPQAPHENHTMHRAYFASRQTPQPRMQARKHVFSKGMIVLISLFATLAVMGFMWVYQAAAYSDLQRDVADMRASIKTQEKTNLELSQKLEELKDGERIRTYAVNKLGMIAPGKGEERTISVILPRTQEVPADTQGKKHYTLLDILLDMLWF